MKRFFSLLIIFCSLSFTHAQWVNIGTLTGTGANYPTVSVVDNNVVWIAGGQSGTPALWRTTNGGTNFNAITPPASFDLTCLYAVSANECFVGDGGSSGAIGGNAKLFRTTNAGANWILINQTGGTAGFFNDIVFSKVNPSDGIAVSNPPSGSGQAFYVLKTTDGGNNWAPESPGSVTGSTGIWHCGIIYDASAYGFGITGIIFPQARATTTGGSSWQTFPVIITGNPIASFAYSDINTIALASTSSVVARTTDQGLSWQTVNSGGAASIKWISGTDVSYFLSGSIIKKSTDEGATWNAMTIGGVTGLKHFDFAKVGDNVYGFGITSTGIVIKLTENITGIKLVNENAPRQFKLYNNYPNPFNPSTKIKLSLPNPSEGGALKTKLTIFDELGREVEILLNEQLNPGTYEVTFDASKYASGTYFYKLTAGDYTKTKKMMLIK